MYLTILQFNLQTQIPLRQ